MDKMQLISNYVRQSYDIFNTYGRSTGSLENICLGFYQVLQAHSADHISKAFNFWLENHSNMPTPAEIKQKCDDYVRWDREKINLSKIERAKPALPSRNGKSVTWYFLPSEVFNNNRDAYLPEMRDHKRFLIDRVGVEKAKSYFNQYLNNYLGYDIRFEEL